MLGGKTVFTTPLTRNTLSTNITTNITNVEFPLAEAVECDARYAGAGPGRLHLNVCGCGRIESIAGRKPGTVECARDRALNYREAGSERACGARANHNQQRHEPLGHLGMSRLEETGGARANVHCV